MYRRVVGPLAFLCVGIVLGATSGSALAEGSVQGTVRLGVAGLELADAGAIVVFLEPVDATSAAGAPLAAVEVRQRGARFEPRFLAVAVGQAVQMPNDDVIYHNVFSYSAPNDFDLGLYAAGESRTLRFEAPGVVRFYCSIHEGMDGMLFVSPSRFYTSPDAQGRYWIDDVPAGRYRVQVWSAKVPGARGAVVIADDQGATLDLVLGTAD